ncbi:unnamed protein product [Symbiodinium sp. KB8]|nr:unnamed protein product [Symbiodinium sp. KB8]
MNLSSRCMLQLDTWLQEGWHRRVPTWESRSCAKASSSQEESPLLMAFTQFQALLGSSPRGCVMRAYAGHHTLLTAKERWEQMLRLCRRRNFPTISADVQALHTFFSLGKYEECARLYDKILADTPDAVHPAVLELGLRCFGLLQHKQRVQEIWSETEKKNLRDDEMFFAMLCALADLGDVEGAAQLVQLMLEENQEINEHILGSAIDACKNREPPSASAARCFFQVLVHERGVQPSTVVFTNLVAAHRFAPVAQLTTVYQQMTQEFGLLPSLVFAETYLGCVLLLGDKFQNARNVEEVADRLAGVAESRQKAARAALRDFRAAGLRLSRLCKIIEKYLSKVNRANMAREDGIQKKCWGPFQIQMAGRRSAHPVIWRLGGSARRLERAFAGPRRGLVSRRDFEHGLSELGISADDLEGLGYVDSHHAFSSLDYASQKPRSNCVTAMRENQSIPLPAIDKNLGCHNSLCELHAGAGEALCFSRRECFMCLVFLLGC